MSRRSKESEREHTRRLVAVMNYLRDRGLRATPDAAEAWIKLEQSMAAANTKETHHHEKESE